MSKYINPYTDFGFKRLFGTEGNKDLLIDFLNCLMPAKHQIQEINFLNVEQNGDITSDRKAIYDIHCKSVFGDLFIVEMQKAKLKFFKDRALFYVTMPIRDQAKKGEWDFNLLPIYYIAILDFEYDEQQEIRKFDRTVQLKDEDGFVFYEKLGFRFLQMPYFNKTESELVSHYDKWCYFLKKLESFDHIPAILNEPVFEKAFKMAEYAALSNKERKEYEKNRLVYLELKAALDTSWEDGKVVGKIEGKIEGQMEEKFKIAKSLKEDGIPLKSIAKSTGLSIQEIEKL